MQFKPLIAATLPRSTHSSIKTKFCQFCVKNCDRHRRFDREHHRFGELFQKLRSYRFYR